MFSYTPDFMPASIILIGAGGTGSRLMPALAQLVRSCIRKYNPNAWLEKLPIFVIDGDTVEEKNLLRQNFIQRDVGQYKAAVLANRYGAAFDLPIYACTHYIPKKEPGTDYPGHPEFAGLPDTQTFNFSNSVVILAVDSAEARRKILNYILTGPDTVSVRPPAIGDDRSSRCFIIDAGNEDAFGQVKFFTPSFVLGGQDDKEQYLRNCPVQTNSNFPVNFIPMDVEYYEGLGESAQELSCMDLPQTLAINAMMSTLILGVLQNFLFLKPMTYDGIRYALDGSVSTEYNTPRRWARRVITFADNSKDYIRRDPVYQEFVNRKKEGLFVKNYDGTFTKFKYTNVATSSSPFNMFKSQLLQSYAKIGLKVLDSGELEAIEKPKPKEVTPPPLTPLPKASERLKTTKGTELPLEKESSSEDVLRPAEAAIDPPSAPAPVAVDIPDVIPPLTPIRRRRAPPPLEPLDVASPSYRAP